MYPASGSSLPPSSTTGSMTTLPGARKKKQDMGFGVTRETGTFFCLFFCYLSAIPFLFVFVYHIFPTTVLSIVVCFALCSAIPIGFNRGRAVVSEPVGPLLSASMLICITLVFVGSMYLYWAHVQPMRALVFAREYKGVYPELPAVSFGDAAYIRFAGNATVETAKSVNMLSLDTGLTTFCVAPVMSVANYTRVQFWAAGVDCCGKSPRGGFGCDDAGKSGVKTAYVMQNPTDRLFNLVGKYIAPANSRRDLFLRAIAKAEYEDGLVSPGADAVLVRFTSQTKEELIEYETLSIAGACVANTLLSVVMALFLTRVVHRFGQLQAQHREDNEENHQLSVRSRLNEFYHNTVDDHLDNLKSIGDLTSRLSAPVWKDMCIMGIVIPFVVLMLCVVLTSYSSCWKNGHLVYAPFLILLGVAILTLLATPGKMTNVVSGLFLLLVSLTGLYIGQVNYSTNVFHYCSIEGRRTYSNVSADASSDTYRDAGILTFGNKAYLSQNHSVGFLYKGVTYCAAPILTRAADCTPAPQNITSAQAQAFLQAELPDAYPSFLQRTSRMQMSLDTDDQTDTSALAPASAPVQCQPVTPTRVDFWAIGTDCCSARKDFSCDGGTDANAHSGVLVRSNGDEAPGGERDQLFHAISQAVAAYDLPVPVSPVFIRWGKDPVALQSEWNWTALSMVGLTAMIGFLVLLGIGLGAFWYMKMLFKQVEAEREALRAKRQPPSSSMWGAFGSQQQQQPSNNRDQLRV